MNNSIVLALLILISIFSCKSVSDDSHIKSNHQCMPTPLERFSHLDSVVNGTQNSKEGMVFIQGGSFEMGSDGNIKGDGEKGYVGSDEFPKHQVEINSFWMDATEVTNIQFKAFVDATGYVTTAEIAPDWEEIKKSLPPGTPRPPDSVLAPASLVFIQTDGPVLLQDYSQWWRWTIGAHWRHPFGPGSNIEGKDNYPVVHISWDDAQSYCKWAGKRLPTEAEWEYASRGGQTNQIYSWGNEHINKGISKANSWEGDFPYNNELNDGYLYTAPVKSYLPNGYGLYDMAGNVWEWCQDWYHIDYYKMIANEISNNPDGPNVSYDPDEPYIKKRVMKGGSFMCNDSYCSGYRNSMRMKSSPDTGSLHTGFRTVMDAVSP
jgi:formylglycine-generating enzyme required for sulfatase activity